MKSYRLVYRGSRDAYYCFDTHTKKRESLGINETSEAQRLVDARNEAVRHVSMNLQIAEVYLQHSDPTLAMRTWQNVMDAMVPLKTGATQSRWISAMRDTAFDLIRHRKLIEISSQHFVQILNAGTISANMFLRRLHNDAIGMHWLPWPILIIETKAEHLFACLKAGTVSTNVHLRKRHNFCLSMNWLP